MIPIIVVIVLVIGLGVWGVVADEREVKKNENSD